jgi:hypothetical protein
MLFIVRKTGTRSEERDVSVEKRNARRIKHAMEREVRRLGYSRKRVREMNRNAREASRREIRREGRGRGSGCTLLLMLLAWPS